MKKLTCILAAVLTIGGVSLSAQHLDIEHNSSSSSDNPHINLLETQSNDFARIRMQSNNAAPNFWEIAGRTGSSNNNLNFYFDSDDISGNYISVFGIGRLVQIGSSSNNVDFTVTGDTELEGGIINGLSISGGATVTGDATFNDEIIVNDWSGGSNSKITLEGQNSNEAVIEQWGNGVTDNNAELRIRNQASAGCIRLYNSSSTLADFEISSNGNIRTRNGSFGVGRIASSDEFEVQGDAGKTSGGTTWNTISDARLKKDVRNFKKGLDVLMQIRPVWFKYNGMIGTDPDKQEIGIIAQEIQEIAPYMIGEHRYRADEEASVEKYLSYNSNALQYIVVNSIQEQQKTIDAQAETITAQQAVIDQLMDRMARLEETASYQSSASPQR